jgi:hypothetical protein
MFYVFVQTLKILVKAHEINEKNKLLTLPTPIVQAHHPIVRAPANTTAIDGLFDDIENDALKNNLTDWGLVVRIFRLSITFGWSLNYASFG